MSRRLGSYRSTPPWWKALVLEWMERRGRGARKELAEAAGCTGGSITQLLQPDRPNRPSSDSSRIAAAVAAHTGIPLPDDLAVDDDMRQFSLDAHELTDEDRKTVHSIIRKMLTAAAKS